MKKKQKEEYKDALPCSDNVASYNIYDGDKKRITVNTMDPSLIESVKNQFPDKSKSGSFGVEINDVKAKDFQKILATQQGELHKKGFKTEKSIKFNLKKIFAAIIIASIIVGIFLLKLK